MPENEAEDIMNRLERHLHLDERVDRLEDRVTILEQCAKNLMTLPGIITDLRILVEGKLSALSTQSKVTWILLTMVIGGLIGLAWALLAK